MTLELILESISDISSSDCGGGGGGGADSEDPESWKYPLAPEDEEEVPEDVKLFNKLLIVLVLVELDEPDELEVPEELYNDCKYQFE